MKIVFFNSYHNGDIHVSREIVNKIVQRVHQQDPGTSFVYSHRNCYNLLADIDNLSFDPHVLNRKGSDHDNLLHFGDMVLINTWYAQQNYKYMNRYGMTMDCLYLALDDSCKSLWGFSLSDISTDMSTFFPSIDYTKFEIASSKVWLSNHPEKKIFVANGHALSGQAVNFDMTALIIRLAQKHSNKTFILTNQECNTSLPNNVVYSSNIIGKQGASDLNENSFISSHCDVIIGRSSGASTFAMTQENLFRRPIKILYFTNIVPVAPNKFWADDFFSNKISYSADIICTNEHNPINVYNIIDTNIA
jgi:hypothetical protein